MENERKITAMGMAAGQARLLSITARMSDNELRAQIINNDKMRLATESSQVSDHYVQALNEAELMFTNYDANNNASFKQLTYNALTSYNPYNNQYALTNASGNILLSEIDAKNYKNSDTLEEFLTCYGLEQTTTYFENLKTNEDGFVIFTNPEIEDDPATPLNETENQSTGLTKKQLELAFLGVDEYKRIHEKDEDFSENDLKINMNRNLVVEPKGYDVTLNSAKMNDYLAALNKFVAAHDNMLSYVNEAMKFQIDKICKNRSGTPTAPGTDLKGFYNKILSLSNNSTISEAVGYLKVFGYISEEFIPDSAHAPEPIKPAHHPDFTIKDSSGGETQGVLDFFAQVKQLVDTNSQEQIENEYKTNLSESPTFACVTKSGSSYIASIEKNSDGKWKVTSYAYKINGTKLQDGDDNQGWTDLDASRVTMGSVGADDILSADSNISIKAISSAYIVKTPNSVENIKNVCGILYNMFLSPDKIWDKNKIDTWIQILIDSGNTNAESAKREYESSAKILADIIYGVGNVIPSSTSIPKIDELSNISLLYNSIVDDNYPAFVHILEEKDSNGNISVPENDFYQIYLNTVLENVQDTYGEPHFAWIDTSAPKGSYNENGEAKARWYENIWNMCEKNGYKILKDGLASSTEWIQYAFESGIVNMQQVDENNNWNPLIYTNCSDITSQTSDKLIAKAEAEYSAAMKKIENKDKRYDLELKNIDTEHNSLQTEYESIKTALDKHIERVFKLYS